MALPRITAETRVPIVASRSDIGAAIEVRLPIGSIQDSLAGDVFLKGMSSGMPLPGAGVSNVLNGIFREGSGPAAIVGEISAVDETSAIEDNFAEIASEPPTGKTLLSLVWRLCRRLAGLLMEMSLAHQEGFVGDDGKAPPPKDGYKIGEPIKPVEDDGVRLKPGKWAISAMPEDLVPLPPKTVLKSTGDLVVPTPDTIDVFMFDVDGNVGALKNEKLGDPIFFTHEVIFTDIGNGRLVLNRFPTSKGEDVVILVNQRAVGMPQHIFPGDVVDISNAKGTVKVKYEIRTLKREDYVKKDADAIFAYNLDRLYSKGFKEELLAASHGRVGGEGHVTLNATFDPKTGRLVTLRRSVYETPETKGTASVVLVVNNNTKIIEQAIPSQWTDPKAQAAMMELEGLSLLVPKEWYLP